MRQVLAFFLMFLQVPSTAVSLRQQRLAELQEFEKKLTNVILRGRPEELFPFLSFQIVIDRETALNTAAVERDIQKRGPIYCRIFDTRCAGKPSAKEVIAASKPEIRFYVPEATSQEDLEFAYITWKPGVFVGLERIGDRWRISALFPTSY